MFVHRAIKKILKILALTLFCPWVIFPQDSQAQELGSFKSEIPFGVRMCFFRGSVDSTKCLVTISVDNENLLFYRGEGYYEAHYEVFLSMRDSKSRYQVRGDWDKKARVPSYDETTLAAHYDPLQEEIYVPSGKYEGFVEVKDMQANTYGNGRVSVVVPDFFTNLPKMSTPLFYDPGELEADTMPALPKPDEFLRSASLKYPAGKPIFMLIDIYADSTAPMEDWSLTAEIVKELMVFPRVEVPIAEGIYAQRRLLKISTQTMSLGSYQIEIKLKDKANNVLARTTSFNFRIIKSNEWVEENYETEIRYLKYLATEKEMQRLRSVPEQERAAALKTFWDKMDPVPATEINELKIQYFERIDYTNKHFSTDQREGWETDMGEVYIMLGPPSEIYGSRLNQIWVYERENLVLYFFGHNLRNRTVFDEYIRERRWWRDSGDSNQ